MTTVKKLMIAPLSLQKMLLKRAFLFQTIAALKTNMFANLPLMHRTSRIEKLILQKRWNKDWNSWPISIMRIPLRHSKPNLKQLNLKHQNLIQQSLIQLSHGLVIRTWISILRRMVVNLPKNCQFSNINHCILLSRSRIILHQITN